MKKILKLSLLFLCLSSFSVSAANLDWVKASKFSVLSEGGSGDTLKSVTSLSRLFKHKNRKFKHTWKFKSTSESFKIDLAYSELDYVEIDAVFFNGVKIASSLVPSIAVEGSRNGVNVLRIVGRTKPGARNSSQSALDELTVDIQETPVPAAIWLFGSALLGMAGLSVRKKSDAAV